MVLSPNSKMNILTKTLGGLALIVGLAGTVNEVQADTLGNSQRRDFQRFYDEGRQGYPEESYEERCAKIGGVTINKVKTEDCCGERTLGFNFQYNKEDALWHKGLEKGKKLGRKICEEGKPVCEDIGAGLCDVGHDVGCAGRDIAKGGIKGLGYLLEEGVNGVIDLHDSIKDKIHEHKARSKCRPPRIEYHYPRTCRPKPLTCAPAEPEFYMPIPQTCRPAMPMPEACTPVAPEIYIPIPETCTPEMPVPLTCRPKHTVIPFNIQRAETCTPQSIGERHAYLHEDGSMSSFDGHLSTGDTFLRTETEHGPNGNTSINYFKRKQTEPGMHQTQPQPYDNPRAPKPQFPRTSLPPFNQIMHLFEDERGGYIPFEGGIEDGIFLKRTEFRQGPRGGVLMNIYERKEPSIHQTPQQPYDNPRAPEPPAPTPNWASLPNNFQRS